MTANINFSTLLTSANIAKLLESLVMPENALRFSSHLYVTKKSERINRLEYLNIADTIGIKTLLITDNISSSDEQKSTDGLIDLFNILFAEQNVELVRGDGEPEYFPAIYGQLARIEFAHGFFASALHELSHWCIAGNNRRQLSDFGYWYSPDGRTMNQQQAFEKVEIKPQAIECLFTLACKRQFQISQDNLLADFDASFSTFSEDVYQQVIDYLEKPQTLPRDAQILLQALLLIFNSTQPSILLSSNDLTICY